MDDKTKKITAETVQYYQFNSVLQNILVSCEVVYYLICMGLYLLIIYWSQARRTDVIVGKYHGYCSDEEGVAEDKDEKILKRQLVQQRLRDAEVLEGYRAAGSVGGSAINQSIVSNNPSLRQAGGKQYGANSFTAGSPGGVSFDASYARRLDRNQQSMRIDSVYSGPSRPHAVRDFVGGRAQIDKRLRLGNAVYAASGEVAQAWDDWADGPPRAARRQRGGENHQYRPLSSRSFASSRP